MSYISDCQMLGLDATVPQHSPDSIKDAFKVLALKLHPDVEGGDAARFEAVRDAYKRLHDEASEKWVKCPLCQGDGYTTRLVGFLTEHVTCSLCNGSGKRL